MIPNRGDIMQCRSCQGETPEGKPFCANCGAAMAQLCSSCGADLIEGKPFCANCGASVLLDRNASGPPGESTVVVAERRLCSVLFVDLVDFTPLAEQRDPESVREL